MEVERDGASGEGAAEARAGGTEKAAPRSGSREVEGEGAVDGAQGGVEDRGVPAHGEEEPLEAETGAPERGIFATIVGRDGEVEDILRGFGEGTFAAGKEEAVEGGEKEVEVAFVSVVADRDNSGSSRFYVFHIRCRDILAVTSTCGMRAVRRLSKDSNNWIIINESMAACSCLKIINTCRVIDQHKNTAYLYPHSENHGLHRAVTVVLVTVSSAVKQLSAISLFLKKFKRP